MTVTTLYQINVCNCTYDPPGYHEEESLIDDLGWVVARLSGGGTHGR